MGRGGAGVEAGKWGGGSREAGKWRNLEARKGKRDFIFIIICPSLRQLENPTGFLVSNIII